MKQLLRSRKIRLIPSVQSQMSHSTGNVQDVEDKSFILRNKVTSKKYST